MNKKLILATVALLAVGAMATGAARAQDAAPPPPGGGPGGPGGPGGRGPGGFGRFNPIAPYKTAFKAVKPTPEQQAKFDALEKAMTKDMAGMRDLDPEERMTKGREMTDKFGKDVEEILTDEQKKTFPAELEKARAAGRPGPMQMFAALNLTDDQKKKVEPIMKDMMDQMQKIRQDDSMERDAKMQKFQQLMTDTKTKIRPILTPEQQKKFDTMPFGFGGRRGGGNRPGGGAGA